MEKKERNLSADRDTLQLCQQLREKMIDQMSKNGGYLSDNLSAVDVTVALHDTFDQDDIVLFSSDRLSFAQKCLYEQGLANSFHENVTLAEAMGVLAANDRQAKKSHVVYVMSDDDILDFDLIRQLQANDLKLIIVYLDRHDKDVNALNKIVNDLRQTEVYNDLKKGVKKSLSNMRSSEQIISGIHRFKDSVKKAIIDEDVFKRYNIDYLGPIDGHDLKQLSRAFRNVSRNSRLVVLHCLVRPGKGYSYAEKGNLSGRVLPFNRKDGRPFVMENDANLKPFTIISKMIRKLMDENPHIICLSNDSLDQDGFADLFARFPDRCLQVKTREEDFLALAKGMMEAGMIPCFYVEPDTLIKYGALLNEMAALQLPVLIYTIDDPALSCKKVSQIGNAYIIKAKDAEDLVNTIYMTDKISEPLIIITEQQCLAYQDIEAKQIEDLGKWRFLVNNEKGKAIILSCGNDLLKLRDIIIANELPYDLLDCGCLNRFDPECLSMIRKNYKYIYYFGRNDLIREHLEHIRIIDGEMEEIFARIKKDLNA